MLVVGGGPAAAAAAVYAARKGIRTGVAAERFGGQVLDTLGIENLISVAHTEGPQLAAALEQRRARLRRRRDEPAARRRARSPPTEPGGLVERQAGQRRHPAVADRRALHRRPLAADERARRGAVPQQGRRLLPALRRAAVQGQARRGDRRRQLRRRGRDRPRRHRQPRHPARVRRPAARRRGAAGRSCAACPTSRSSRRRSPPRCTATAAR